MPTDDKNSRNNSWNYRYPRPITYDLEQRKNELNHEAEPQPLKEEDSSRPVWWPSDKLRNLMIRIDLGQLLKTNCIKDSAHHPCTHSPPQSHGPISPQDGGLRCPAGFFTPVRDLPWCSVSPMRTEVKDAALLTIEQERLAIGQASHHSG